MNIDLLAGMTIDATAKKWQVSSASLSRHRLSHLDRSIRQPDRIDEDRSAADVLVGMADRLSDLDRIANAALQRGQSTAAVKAATEARQLGKLLFHDLALDSTALAEWLRDLDHFFQAVTRWARESPAVLTAIAARVQDDPRLARELRAGHDLLVAAKRTTEMEPAA